MRKSGKTAVTAIILCALIGNIISFAEEFKLNAAVKEQEENGISFDPYRLEDKEWQFDEVSGEYVYTEEYEGVLDERFVDWLINWLQDEYDEHNLSVQDLFMDNKNTAAESETSDLYNADQDNVAASGIPNLHAKVTVENAVNLLSVYDPDGAYILQHNQKEKGKMLSYWHDDKLAGDGINTAVHELCHSYSFTEGGLRNEAIYIGNEEAIFVEYTPVFNSREMAVLIPEELRTFRYNTYVASDDQSLASQVKGPYGLLNELTAYYWGTNTSVKLFDYYQTQSPTIDEWFDCITSATSSYYAYAEFRFFILRYMLYARDNHPEVYQEILSNDNFRRAFTIIDKKFETLVEEMDKGIEEIKEIVRNKGVSVEETQDTLWFGNNGRKLFKEEYYRLMSEMEKPEYQEMLVLLEP